MAYRGQRSPGPLPLPRPDAPRAAAAAAAFLAQVLWRNVVRSMMAAVGPAPLRAPKLDGTGTVERTAKEALTWRVTRV